MIIEMDGDALLTAAAAAIKPEPVPLQQPDERSFVQPAVSVPAKIMYYLDVTDSKHPVFGLFEAV